MTPVTDSLDYWKLHFEELPQAPRSPLPVYLYDYAESAARWYIAKLGAVVKRVLGRGWYE